MEAKKHSFTSANGTVYEYQLDEIVELSESQRNDIGRDAAKMTDQDIRQKGITIWLEKSQAEIVQRKIKEIVGHFSLVDLVRKQLILFAQHAGFRMGDPARSANTQLEVYECLQQVTLPKRCTMTVHSQYGQAPVQMKHKLNYRVESPKPAMLCVQVSRTKNGKEYVLIVTVLTA